MSILAKPLPEHPTTPYSRRWVGLGILCLSLMVILMANLSISVAAVKLTEDEHVTTSQLQWIIDGYTVPYASLMLLLAALGDKYGRRVCLNLGLLIVGLGSLYGGVFAHGPGQIITARAIMGVGAALIMPATLSLLVAMFPKRERAVAITIWSSTAGVAIVTGPLVAGYLLKFYSWQVTFIMNIPACALMIGLALILVPPSKARHRTPIDYLGGVLSVIAVACTVYSSIEGPHYGWSAKAIAAAIVAVISLILFVVWELYCKYPMLQLRKFRNRYFSGAFISAITLFMVVFGAFFALIQNLQFVYDLDPFASGLRLLPLVGTVALGGVVTALLVPRVGVKIIVPIGILISAGALGMIYYLGDHVDQNTYSFMVIPICLVGFTLGLCISPAADILMGSFIEDKLGIGGALNDTGIELGGSLGVAFLGTIVSKVYSTKIGQSLDQLMDHMQQMFTDQSVASRLTPEQIQSLLAKREQFEGYIPQIKDSIGVGSIVAQKAKGTMLQDSLVDSVNTSYTQAFSTMALVGMIILIVAAVLVFFVFPFGRGAIEDLVYPEYDIIMVDDSEFDISDQNYPNFSTITNTFIAGTTQPEVQIDSIEEIDYDSELSELADNGVVYEDNFLDPTGTHEENELVDETTNLDIINVSEDQVSSEPASIIFNVEGSEYDSQNYARDLSAGNMATSAGFVPPTFPAQSLDNPPYTLGRPSSLFRNDNVEEASEIAEEQYAPENADALTGYSYRGESFIDEPQDRWEADSITEEDSEVVFSRFAAGDIPLVEGYQQSNTAEPAESEPHETYYGAAANVGEVNDKLYSQQFTENTSPSTQQYDQPYIPRKSYGSSEITERTMPASASDLEALAQEEFLHVLPEEQTTEHYVTLIDEELEHDGDYTLGDIERFAAKSAQYAREVAVLEEASAQAAAKANLFAAKARELAALAAMHAAKAESQALKAEDFARKAGNVYEGAHSSKEGILATELIKVRRR